MANDLVIATAPAPQEIIDKMRYHLNVLQHLAGYLKEFGIEAVVATYTSKGSPMLLLSKAPGDNMQFRLAKPDVPKESA